MGIKETIVEIPDEVDQIALCGGPYSNFSATDFFLQATKNIRYRFCLGDIPGCGGALPDKTIQLLRDSNVICIQGNYDHSIGNGTSDCGCGYVDERDRAFAQISYDYNLKNVSNDNRTWLRGLPAQLVLKWRGQRILLAHGSPDNINEFVWDTQTPDHKILDWLNRNYCAGICVTHSGLPWIRQVRGMKQGFWLNVGVIGRPAHEGLTHVYYGLLNFPKEASRPEPMILPLEYDYSETAAAIRSEELPEEFALALELGVWTTGDNILPKEEKAVRARRRNHETQSSKV